MNSTADPLEMTDEQLQAINSDAKAIVVLANAGGGKTETVARRVLRLLEATEGVSRILALSYTNKAADELRDRLRRRVGALSERVTVETVHGFAHALVRQHGSRIGLPVEPELLTRDEDRVELLSRWRASEGRPPSYDPVQDLRKVDLDRSQLVQSPEVVDWRNALSSLPGLDYPGLLDSAAELLELKSVRRQVARTYKHVIVDEAQNLTPAQFRLIDLLTPLGADGPTAMLVGDDKQSIVSFAGADPALLDRFVSERQALVIRLSRNFRSARQLSALGGRVARDLGQQTAEEDVHAAEGVIKMAAALNERDEGRQVAEWVQDLLDNGLPVDALPLGESTVVGPDDIAVLGRSASALRETTDALQARGVPFSASSSASDWLEGVVGRILLEIVALHAAPAHVSTQWQLSRLLDVNDGALVSLEDVRVALMSHFDPMVTSVAPLIDEVSVAQLVDRLDEIAEPEEADSIGLAAWNSDKSEIRRAWSEFQNTTDRDARSWSSFRVFCSRRQRGSATGGVQLLTVHKAQGREFKAVVLVGMNDGQIPDFRAKSPADQKSELRTFYVAVTRARRALFLTRAKSRQTRFGPRLADPSPYLRYLNEVDG